jgi:uncharacterized damage-inducible protein DinB
MGIKDGLLAEFDHEMGTTRRLLERVPDDRLQWKPHDKSMALGELATHLTNLPNWGSIILNERSFDLANSPPPPPPRSSCAEIVEAFDRAVRDTRALMAKSDGEYSELWALKRGGHDVFAMPRVAAFRTFVINHVIHHRGQLSVYLRLNGVMVPPIYGPTADEG